MTYVFVIIYLMIKSKIFKIWIQMVEFLCQMVETFFWSFPPDGKSKILCQNVGIRCIYPILYSVMSGDLVFTLAFCYFQSNRCNIVKSFSVYWIYPKSFRLANRFVYYTSFYLLSVVPSRFESLFLIFGPSTKIWILNAEVQNNKHNVFQMLDLLLLVL